jgi:uncharacterized protein (TIGR02217 family)
MAFHQVRFPLDVALGARGGPERLTDIVTLTSGAEERNSRWADSRRRFDAGYGIKSLTDMQVVLAFFEERRGRFHSFLWKDALDYASSPPGATVSPVDQPLGTGDGSTTQFQRQNAMAPASTPMTARLPSRLRPACGLLWMEWRFPLLTLMLMI